MKKLQTSFATLGLCAAILMPGTAKAAFVTIDDTSAAETITISWGGFLSGVLVNNVAQPVSGSFTINENVANTINFSGIWNSGGLAVGQTLVDFYEDNTLAVVSDNLSYSVGIGAGISTFILSFTSDVEGTTLSPQSGPVLRQFVEGLDANGNPLAYTFGYNNLDVSVTSAPEAVPEPSTYLAGALLALVFGVQGVRSLRSRKQTA